LIIRRPRSFWTGVVGLLIFFIVIAFWVVPWQRGPLALHGAVRLRSGITRRATYIERVDHLFNQLTKYSAHKLEPIIAQAKRRKGERCALTVTVKRPDDAAEIAAVCLSNGASAQQERSTVRIAGDLGGLGEAALQDANQLFHGQDQEIQARYDMSGKRVTYYWWLVFDALQRQCVRRRDSAGASFAESVKTKAIEPAYNLHGIIPLPVSRVRSQVLLLLAFYVGYTIWYGVSIMCLFAGFGITLTETEKSET